MIPRKIHYCWFGKGEMPQSAKDCIASWHKHMPDCCESREQCQACSSNAEVQQHERSYWEYKLWNEDSFDIESMPYTSEAYATGKYAFVSDYVRLWALEHEGGVYMDVDFEVYKPFDDLLHHHAFAGIEGSKHHPVMMGVCASEAHGEWVKEMLEAYRNRHFLKSDGTPDFTTNVQFITALMATKGFRQDGTEQDYKDLHILPVDYFSPRHTTGEYIRTENTYCEHKGLASWSSNTKGWKDRVLDLVGQKNRTRLIKLKRKLIG